MSVEVNGKSCNISETDRRALANKVKRLRLKMLKPINPPSMQAVGYCRLSSSAATVDDLSMQRQRDTIAAYCAANGLTLTGTYEDVRVSGRKVSRDGLERAITEAVLRGAVLIVPSIDRLIRDHRVLLRLRDENVLFRALDCCDANELTINIMVSLAQAYSQAVSTKLKAYHAHHKAKVERGEAQPLPVPAPTAKRGIYTENLKRGVARNKAKAQSYAQKAWSIIEPMWSRGDSLNVIAGELNRLGYASPSGKQWHRSTVSRVVSKFSPKVPLTV